MGKMTVWVIDNKGDLFVRKEITPLNPGGIYWRKVLNKGKNGVLKCANEKDCGINRVFIV